MAEVEQFIPPPTFNFQRLDNDVQGKILGLFGVRSLSRWCCVSKSFQAGACTVFSQKRHLDFCYYRPREMSVICALMAKHARNLLRRVDFSFSQELDRTGMLKLMEANPGLEVIKFGKDSYSTTLIPALPHLYQLRIIFIWSDMVDLSGIERFTTLEALAVWCRNCSSPKKLADILDNCRLLRVLDMDGFDCTTIMQYLKKIPPRITHLHTKCISLSDDKMPELFPHLRFLTISGPADVPHLLVLRFRWLEEIAIVVPTNSEDCVVYLRAFQRHLNFLKNIYFDCAYRPSPLVEAAMNGVNTWVKSAKPRFVVHWNQMLYFERLCTHANVKTLQSFEKLESP